MSTLESDPKIPEESGLNFSKTPTFKEGVFISTYGCQMNVNDTERMYALLEMKNYVPVQTPDEASLILINSCSVREKPVHKVHSEVGTFRKLKESNPNLKIGVGGCVGQQEKKTLLKDLPLVDFVFGPDNIDQLPDMVQELHEGVGRKSYARFEHGKPYDIQTMVRNPGVSTFVNITKGCDNFCSFCVVPYTRGRLRSRPLKDVVNDVRLLTKRGVREVTLLGQNVNSYESECGANFGELIRRLAVETEIERIRFTTSHPKDFNEDLVQIMARHRDKICDYIHLPVQSGSSRILELMNRGYTRQEYLEKVAMIRRLLPGVVLSTDIIIGFPGETEEEYLETFSLVKEVGFEAIYAFKYSPRPFTKAAQYGDQVPESIKTRRLNELLAMHKVEATQLTEQYMGQTLPVLVEKVDDREKHLMVGRSSQNRLIQFEGDSSLIGQTVPVKIQKISLYTCRGELAGVPS